MRAWVVSLVFIALIFTYAWWLMQRPAVNTDLLNQSMLHVVQAKTVAEREQALISSLNQLAQIADTKDLSRSNGNFFLAQGDIYRHFQALPWAMWSYRQAEMLAPGNPLISKRIAQVSQELNLDEPKASILEPHFSLARRLQLFTLAAVLAFTFASLAIWQKSKIWTASTYFFAAMAALFLLSSLYTRYFEAESAVLVQSSTLMSASSDRAAVVGGVPLAAGSTVSVIDVVEDGEWIKVLTADGSQGFISSERIRLLTLQPR